MSGVKSPNPIVHFIAKLSCVFSCERDGSDVGLCEAHTRYEGTQTITDDSENKTPPKEDPSDRQEFLDLTEIRFPEARNFKALSSPRGWGPLKRPIGHAEDKK